MSTPLNDNINRDNIGQFAAGSQSTPEPASELVTNGQRPIELGGVHTTFGVGPDLPVRRIWVLNNEAGDSVVHADVTVKAELFAPAHLEDKSAWLDQNAARIRGFMMSRYQLEPCIEDDPDAVRDAAWDGNGDLWLTGYIFPTTPPATEEDAYNLAITQTKAVEVQENAPYLGVQFRDYLGMLWANGKYGELGTEKPSARIQEILENAFSGDNEEALGFDTMSVLTPEEQQKFDEVLTAATGHPRYIDFAGLDLDVESDDLDDVNDNAHAVADDTLARLGYRNHRDCEKCGGSGWYEEEGGDRDETVSTRCEG